MSTVDAVISTVLLVALGSLVAGWLLVQLVGEVLYRRFDRGLPRLRWPVVRRPRRVRAGT